MVEQYFEDMWLAVENELSSFDSFKPSEYSSQPASSENIDSQNGPGGTNLEPSTYEELLQLRNEPAPSDDKLRSRDRATRIEAVRELYNKFPTIINGSSLARLHKTASILYKRGLIRQADSLLKAANKTMDENFSYVIESDEGFKILSYENELGRIIASVEVTDKYSNTSMVEEFDNLLEAVKCFKN